MPNEEAGIKMLTLEEANALLPPVRQALKSLREQRNQILKTQAQIEIEELTGTNSQGHLSPTAQAALTTLMETFQSQSSQFEKGLEKLFLVGAHLKDLESGLVDFYSRRGSEVVFLCWKEGESKISHWHTLQGGFQNRKSL
jgi:hypothetical protein